MNVTIVHYCHGRLMKAYPSDFMEKYRKSEKVLIKRHTTWPEVCGHPTMQPYVIVECSLICCYNSLHSSGFSLSGRCWTCCRDLLLFSHNTISEVQHWCWWSNLAHNWCSSSSQRCWIRLRSGLSADQSSSCAPNWENHFLMELLCARDHCHVDRGNRQTQTVDTKLEEHSLKYHCSVRFPFFGTERPWPLLKDLFSCTLAQTKPCG